MRTILYYPSITIPNNDWLRCAILYWDQIASIVPTKENRWFSDDIHYLIDQGQYRPIFPKSLIEDKYDSELLDDFQDEFIEAINSQQFKQILKFQIMPLYCNIHLNKLSYSLINALRDMGLARRTDSTLEWIEVDNNVALLYMSILAKYLARIDSDSTVIGSDTASCENLTFAGIDRDDAQHALSIDFAQILPVPVEPDFKKIVRYKAKRIDELNHFNSIIASLEHDLSNAHNINEMTHIIHSFKQKLEREVSNLNLTMKEENIHCVLKSFKSLIDLKSSTSLLTAASLYDASADTLVSAGMKTALIAFAGLVQLSEIYIDSRNKKRKALRENPYSYVYHSMQSGIITN